jgi:hypothetical protein
VVGNKMNNQTTKLKKLYNVLLLLINSLLYLVVIALWISIPDEMTLNIIVTLLTFFLTLVSIYLNKEKLSVYYQSHHFKKLQEALVFFGLLFALLGIVNYWAYKHPQQLD